MSYRGHMETGGIEVICGPMFSGKTEELIRRLRLARIAKQRVQIFKPILDNRFDTEHITSHLNQKFVCTPVETAGEMIARLQDTTRVVGIDEAQFFREELVGVCEKLANRRLRVIVAGLDQDYLGKPFGPIPQLLAIADEISKLKAVCMVCGGEAAKSQRLTAHKEQVVVGAAEHYEARCRLCFDPEVSEVETKPAIEGKRESAGRAAPQ